VDGLLALSGPITAVPLTLFAVGARRLPLSAVGLLQYIAPTCNLLLAVLLYDEPFTAAHTVTFALVWAGLILYTIDLNLRLRRLRSVEAA
jgi:chloramphenicol-sensitive protein RarD